MSTFGTLLRPVQFLNCRLYVQLETGVPDLESLPVVQRMLKGDILQFGKNPARHWAIYIGNAQVREVAEWGAQPKTNSVRALVDEYGPAIIRRKP